MIVLYTTEREYRWGCLRSTNASKVKIVLEEKALVYRVERMRPGDLWKKPPEFLAKHPLGKVPYIEHGDVLIYDSTVINEYLDEAYPTPAFMPRGALARAKARMLENFCDEAVLVGDLPPLWMPYWSPPEQRDLEAMERGRAGLRTHALPYLERTLNAADYLCGDFSLADVGFMVMAMVLEVDGFDLHGFPRTASYLSRLRARPSYRAISANTPLLESAGRS
jgi:glutathione S-transferase